MNKSIGGWSLAQALKQVGFPLPDECADVHIEMPIDGIMQIIYRVNLTDETIKKVGEAFDLVSRGDK